MRSPDLDSVQELSPLLPAHLQQRIIDPMKNVSVIEKEGNTMIQFDLLSRLMKDRIISERVRMLRSAMPFCSCAYGGDARN